MRRLRTPIRVRRWLFRLFLASAVSFSFGWLPYQVYGGAGLGRLTQLKRELGELKGKNAAMTAENDHLRAEVHGLRYDVAAIERVAREELGLVRPGEIVFQIEAAP